MNRRDFEKLERILAAVELLQNHTKDAVARDLLGRAKVELLRLHSLARGD